MRSERVQGAGSHNSAFRHSVRIGTSELLDVPLFENLGASELDWVTSISYGCVVPTKIDLIRLGQPSAFLFFLLEGTVRVHLNREDQPNVVLSILGRGEMLGDISALDGHSASAGVQTMEECRLLVIAHNDFTACLSRVPQIMQNLVRLQARRIRRLTAHSEALASLGSDARLVRELLVLAADHGRPVAFGSSTKTAEATTNSAATTSSYRNAVRISLRLTQADLASLCGSSSKQVYRIMAKLQATHLLAIEEGFRIILLDPAQLRSMYLPSIF